MPIALTPADLTDLKLSSPALGPWFSQSATVQAPSPDLSASVTLSANTNWLPPASGVLSLYMGASPLPLSIATLRNAQGSAPFANGRLVAVYQLLPEVEERLDALMKFIPPVNAAPPAAVPATAGTAANRARVRWLALEFPDGFLGSSPLAEIFPLLPPPSPPSTVGAGNDTRAAYLGLKMQGSALANGDAPMADLRRAGQYTLPLGGGTGQDMLLQNLPSGTYKLWAFDARGNAIDPGAVAAWWTYLGQIVFSNLWGANVWPSSTPVDQQVVCAADPKLTVHLVNPHEGALVSPLLNGRLTLTGADAGTTALHSAAGSTGISFAFADPTDTNVNDAPVPRVALLPSGQYASTLSVWPGGPVGTTGSSTKLLQRDFVRVAAVDVESFLVGQQRGSTTITDSSTPAEKRAADQNRASTRVNVARATNADSVLQPTAEAATQELLGVFTATAPRRLVTSTVSRGFGAIGFRPGSETDADAFHTSLALPVLPAGTKLPFDLNSDGTTVPFYRVLPLAGGDVPIDGSPRKQRVLFEFTLPAGFTGAWIRVWPEGFDDTVGVHVRMDGGGGRVNSSTIARVVATLPDVGTLGPSAPAAFTAMIVTASGSRTYADKRFDRPAPPASDAPATLGAGSTWLLCETGESGTGGLGGRYVAGMTVVVGSGDHFAIVDPSTFSSADFSPSTLASKIAAGDAIELTTPAFKTITDRMFPNGEPAPTSTTTGDPADGLGSVCTVDLCPRVGAASLVAPGGPSATMERLEVAASNLSGTTLSAAIATAPGIGIYHELLPHDAGHPGAPGAAEVHGTGARLDGNAALGIVEAVRDRTAGLGLSFFAGLSTDVKTLVARSTPLLAAEAALTPLPTLPDALPTDSGVWAATLRTVAPGVEGEALGFAAKGMIAAGLYPFSGATDTTLHNWINQAVGALPGGTAVSGPVNNALNTIHPNELSVERAMDRRIKASAFGLREAAFSIKAAFDRAEQFVYIETPALDNKDCGPTGTTPDLLNLWNALTARASSRPGLRVIVCAPLHMMPGTPVPLEDVRTAMMLDALDALRRTMGDQRLAVFYPSAATGRSLRMSSTTVIVDDAYALTGTTHLWRRGLSFDSSLAVAVFDDRLENGRPKEVRTFRRRLIAGRLGVSLTQLPEDAAELVKAINILVQRGSSRVTSTLPGQPRPFTPEGEATVLDYPTSTDNGPSASDRDTWNPNGFDASLTFDNLWAKLRRTTAKGSVDAVLSGS